MQTRFRALAPADAALTAGATVQVGTLATAGDPGVATGAFAAEQVLVLLLTEEDLAPGGEVRAGTTLEVVGERRLRHHLPSAVDIEILALALATPGVAGDDREAGFSQAMARITLALAAGGADGRLVPSEYAGSVQP